MKYYSQNGEDCILWSLFPTNSAPGFFIDIGALDGIHLSNTYSFEQAAWKGLCVEAHPDYIPLLTKNRPGSQVVHAAVSFEDRKSTKFYSSPRGSLSTLNTELEGHFKKNFKPYFNGWKPVNVQMRSIDSLLAEMKFSGTVDVVSIDIEGGEVNALRGFSVTKHKPRVLVLEALTDKYAKELDSILFPCNYVLARTLSNNRFYCRDREDAAIISRANKNLPRESTVHPLDKK